MAELNTAAAARACEWSKSWSGATAAAWLLLEGGRLARTHRIKVWDAVKGHLQTEFANIAQSSAAQGILGAAPTGGGHLSLDYTCIKWVQLGIKKKKKPGSSLLVLGTGHGDVLVVDVAAGQLKWKFADCHPGGVSAISFSRHNSCIYTGGVDCMVCQIDPANENLLSKYKASTKAISSMSISPDTRIGYMCRYHDRG